MTLSQMVAEGHGWQVWSCWRPRTGYAVGGDLCYAYSVKDKLFIALVDVLGHGAEAYRSAEKLFQVLEERREDLLSVYSSMERAAARARGCALFLGTLTGSTLNYIMVGNIRGWVIEHKEKLEALLGQPGVVGGRRLMPVVREVKAGASSLIIVCSDGIRRSFVPGWEGGQLALGGGAYVATKILEEYSIPEDDASVLVGRRCS